MRRRSYNNKTVSDYVSSGLLVSLDGYDAPQNGKWVSRVNGYTFSTSNIVYDSTNHKYNFTNYGIVSDQDIAYESNAITIQLIDDGTIYNNTSLAILFESSSNFNNYTNSFIIDISELVARALLLANRSTTSGYRRMKGTAAQTRNAKSQYTFMLGSNYFKLYINGTDATNVEIDYSGTPYTILPNYSSYPLYFGARGVRNYVTNLGCNAMRLYNRILTTAEMATNLAADKQRFNF